MKNGLQIEYHNFLRPRDRQSSVLNSNRITIQYVLVSIFDRYTVRAICNVAPDSPQTRFHSIQLYSIFSPVFLLSMCVCVCVWVCISICFVLKLWSSYHHCCRTSTHFARALYSVYFHYYYFFYRFVRLCFVLFLFLCNFYFGRFSSRSKLFVYFVVASACKHSPCMCVSVVYSTLVPSKTVYLQHIVFYSLNSCFGWFYFASELQFVCCIVCLSGRAHICIFFSSFLLLLLLLLLLLDRLGD